MAQPSKRERILEAAGTIFMRQGYRKASMDAIAAATPVSKPTLYHHFTDKKTLFAAVIAARCQVLLEKIEARIDEASAPEAALSAIGETFLSMVLSPEALTMQRIVAAECMDFPDMAKLFYASGPAQAHALLSRYLAHQHARKRLSVPEPERAADMFLSTVKGYAQLQCLLGLRDGMSAKERARHIDYAVSLFLKAHAGASAK